MWWISQLTETIRGMIEYELIPGHSHYSFWVHLILPTIFKHIWKNHLLSVSRLSQSLDLHSSDRACMQRLLVRRIRQKQESWKIALQIWYRVSQERSRQKLSEHSRHWWQNIDLRWMPWKIALPLSIERRWKQNMKHSKLRWMHS